MPPLGHKLEVAQHLSSPRHTYRPPRAMYLPIFPAPGFRVAVHAYKIFLAQRPPARARSVQVCSGKQRPRRFIRERKRNQCKDHGYPTKSAQTTAERKSIHLVFSPLVTRGELQSDMMTRTQGEGKAADLTRLKHQLNSGSQTSQVCYDRRHDQRPVTQAPARQKPRLLCFAWLVL